MSEPTIYRCTGTTTTEDPGCVWIGFDEASAQAHSAETDHECELWEDVTPEELEAAALAMQRHAVELRRYGRGFRGVIPGGKAKGGGR